MSGVRPRPTENSNPSGKRNSVLSARDGSAITSDGLSQTISISCTFFEIDTHAVLGSNSSQTGVTEIHVYVNVNVDVYVYVNVRICICTCISLRNREPCS